MSARNAAITFRLPTLSAIYPPIRAPTTPEPFETTLFKRPIISSESFRSARSIREKTGVVRA
jgi:hypothetical protein